MSRPAKSAAHVAARGPQRGGSLPRHADQSAAAGRLEGASWRRRVALGGLLVAITVVAYAPAIRGGFFGDDSTYVTENATLRSTRGLSRIWFEPRATDQYYPLVFTTFWIEHQLWGTAPLGYHVTNIALHALTAVLVWMVLLGLNVPGAWLAAALFALHPVHAESVAWVAERKDVLSGALYLLTVLVWVRFVASRDWRYYTVALVRC